MKGYLGTTQVEQKDTIYKDYTEKDWILYFIEEYGQIDGALHKDWVIDQVVRILKGTKIEIEKAEWENGHSELRVSLEEGESEDYKQWVIDMKDGEDGPDTYSYDPGIAP